MNQLTLSAVLVEREQLRYTPAGLPILMTTLLHESEQKQEEIKQNIQFEIKAMIVGKTALVANELTTNTRYLFSGFLAATRKGSQKLVLHITSWTLSTELC